MTTWMKPSMNEPRKRRSCVWNMSAGKAAKGTKARTATSGAAIRKNQSLAGLAM